MTAHDCYVEDVWGYGMLARSVDSSVSSIPKTRSSFGILYLQQRAEQHKRESRQRAAGSSSIDSEHGLAEATIPYLSYFTTKQTAVVSEERTITY